MSLKIKLKLKGAIYESAVSTVGLIFVFMPVLWLVEDNGLLIMVTVIIVDVIFTARMLKRRFDIISRVDLERCDSGVIFNGNNASVYKSSKFWDRKIIISANELKIDIYKGDVDEDDWLFLSNEAERQLHSV